MENLPGLQQANFQYCANPSLCKKLTEFQFHILLPGIKGIRGCTAVKGLQQTMTDMVFFAGEKEKHSTSLVGKDYKRLLARLEQRDAKVAKVKEVDPDAAARLEEKHVWQVCM